MGIDGGAVLACYYPGSDPSTPVTIYNDPMSGGPAMVGPLARGLRLGRRRAGRCGVLLQLLSAWLGM